MHHIFYVSDAKYRPYAEIAAASVRWNSPDVEVHIIDADDPEIARRLQGLPEYHESRAPYVRLLAPELFPELDWILYVDGDTLGLGDIGKVFEHCDPTKLIVGSRDIAGFNIGADVEGPWLREHGLSFGDSSICTGVMLMNLKAMREENITARCIEFLRTYGAPPLADQTVLNCVCRGRIGVLPSEWGVFSMCPEGVDFSGNAIIHYPQDLPWNRGKLNKLMNDYVCLWHWFVSIAGLPKVSVPGWWWRRAVYLVIKHLPWTITWCPYLKVHLRPMCGLPRSILTTILSRWDDGRVVGLTGIT